MNINPSPYIKRKKNGPFISHASYLLFISCRIAIIRSRGNKWSSVGKDRAAGTRDIRYPVPKEDLVGVWSNFFR